MPRETSVRVPVGESEHAEIAARALKAGRTGCDWLRRLALGHEPRPPKWHDGSSPDGRAQGRPRKMSLRIPCNEAERTEIHRRALLAGRAAADWIRRLAFGFDVAPPPTKGVVMQEGRARRREPATSDAAE